MKMRLVSMLVLLPALPAPAHAEPPAQFKAIIRMAGGEQGDSRWIVNRGATRIRLELADDPAKQIYLIDPARELQYLLAPDERSYSELPFLAEVTTSAPILELLDAANPCADDARTGCRRTGAETVSGQPTEKWEYSRIGVKYTAWISPKFRLALRTVAEDGSTVEFGNLVAGPQAAALFEIPAGYGPKQNSVPDMGAIEKMLGEGGSEALEQLAAMAAKMEAAQPKDSAGSGDAGGSGGSGGAPVSVWEKGKGWILDLTVTARHSAPGATYSGKYTASIPLNYGTPRVLRQVGPMWTYLPTPEELTPEVKALPVAFASQTESKVIGSRPAACPIDSAMSWTITSSGSSSARISMEGLSTDLQAQAVLKFSPDLKSYGLTVGIGTPRGTEQITTVSTTSGCGDPPSTENKTETSEKGADLSFELDGVPLPPSRSALTGSKTLPIRIRIAGFDGPSDATIQWNITPIGGK